jgi:hypothetical protein
VLLILGTLTLAFYRGSDIYIFEKCTILQDACIYEAKRPYS